MKSKEDFYKFVVDENLSNRTAKILICGGGDLDAQVFSALNFKNVTISNLDETRKSSDFGSILWVIEDLENLSYPDNFFDYVVVHDALHHTSRPHTALLEMYRVARLGVLAVENRESLLMRILEILKISKTYEQIAVYRANGLYGGVNNTEVPNFIYRWTEREIEKCVQTYNPICQHKINFYYSSSPPYALDYEAGARAKKVLVSLLTPFYILFTKCAPRQQNLFAFFIEKPNELAVVFPWLKRIGRKIGFDMQWGEQHYKSGREK